MELSDKFKKMNKVSLEIATKIEEVLKFKGLPSLIPIINSCSICVKLPKQYSQLNSTLCIDQRGFGKSTLLIHILAESNPKFFVILPKKVFESRLIEKPREYYHNKVLIHDDLTVSFGGTTTKQRQQLTNFFTQLLSDGRYEREGKSHLKDIVCLAHFGVAWESYKDHRKDLLNSTFLDRFSLYKVPLKVNQQMEILEMRDEMKDKNTKLPKIKLPLIKRKKVIKLNLTTSMKEERNKLAMELHEADIMTACRAQNYIDIFLMSNAFLNGRDAVVLEDLELYKVIHKYHKNASLDSDKIQRIKDLRKENPSISVKEIKKITKISTSTIYRLLKILN